MPQYTFFPTNLQSSGQPKNDAKTLFSPPSVLYPRLFLQLQQWWHLYWFAVLGSTSIVIHSVKQRLLEIGPKVTLRPLATSCAKDYKGPSLQTSFTEPPNSAGLNWIGRRSCFCFLFLVRCSCFFNNYYLHDSFLLFS